MPRIESPTTAPNETPAPQRGRLSMHTPVLAIPSILVLGVLARIGSVLHSHLGLRGNYSYDAAVYYTAADALLHGRVPYRQFVLLHPPGAMLTLTPFAALGTWTSDRTGFVAGNLAFIAIGIVNGALVYLAARRIGLPLTPAWLGGAFYAVWAGTVFVDTSSRLEPLGNFAVLLGVLALTGAGSERRLRTVLGGAALGFAVSVKIWWVLPVAAFAIWMWRRGDGLKRVRDLLLGATGIVMLVCGPFFVMAPRSMVKLVVLDQIGRDYVTPLKSRLVTLSTISNALTGMNSIESTLAAAAFVVVFVAICVLGWRFAPARLFVVLAIAELALLLTAPPFFEPYLDYLAPCLGIALAAAVHTRVRGLPARVPGAAVVAAAALITATGTVSRGEFPAPPLPSPEVAARWAGARCVTAITPIPLIQLDLLTRTFDNGCPQWVDSYGRAYVIDRGGTGSRKSAQWNVALRRYLLTGNVIVLTRPDGSVDPRTFALLQSNPRLRVIYRATTGSGQPGYRVDVFAVSPRHRATVSR